MLPMSWWSDSLMSSTPPATGLSGLRAMVRPGPNRRARGVTGGTHFDPPRQLTAQPEPTNDPPARQGTASRSAFPPPSLDHAGSRPARALARLGLGLPRGGRR